MISMIAFLSQKKSSVSILPKQKQNFAPVYITDVYNNHLYDNKTQSCKIKGNDMKGMHRFYIEQNERNCIQSCFIWFFNWLWFNWREGSASYSRALDEKKNEY